MPIVHGPCIDASFSAKIVHGPCIDAKELPFVQITGSWTFFRQFCIDISSMDPILMRPIVHGLSIGVKRLVICADIKLMDETGSSLIAV